MVSNIFFRSALQNERETFNIYQGQLGSNHDKTKESSDCLKHLTQQAVVSFENNPSKKSVKY